MARKCFTVKAHYRKVKGRKARVRVKAHKVCR